MLLFIVIIITLVYTDIDPTTIVVHSYYWPVQHLLVVLLHCVYYYLLLHVATLVVQLFTCPLLVYPVVVTLRCCWVYGCLVYLLGWLFVTLVTLYTFCWFAVAPLLLLVTLVTLLLYVTFAYLRFGLPLVGWLVGCTFGYSLLYVTFVILLLLHLHCWLFICVVPLLHTGLHCQFTFTVTHCYIYIRCPTLFGFNGCPIYWLVCPVTVVVYIYLLFTLLRCVTRLTLLLVLPVVVVTLLPRTPLLLCVAFTFTHVCDVVDCYAQDTPLHIHACGWLVVTRFALFPRLLPVCWLLRLRYPTRTRYVGARYTRLPGYPVCWLVDCPRLVTLRLGYGCGHLILLVNVTHVYGYVARLIGWRYALVYRWVWWTLRFTAHGWLYVGYPRLWLRFPGYVYPTFVGVTRLLLRVAAVRYVWLRWWFCRYYG